MRPILFHLGALPIRAYGTMLIVGFLLSLWRTMRVAARRTRTEPEGSPRRIHPDTIFDLGIVCLFSGVIGARVLFVLLDWSTFIRNPAVMFRIWEGGLSLHGGLLGGLLALVIFCLRKRLSILAVADAASPAFAIAYSVGRIGCLLNGCCYGAACSLPWAVRFVDEQDPRFLTPPSHPIQLYATIINTCVFFFLARWEKRPHRDGELFWAYVAIYGAYRYAMEFFRAGATSTYLIPSIHLTDTHIVSVLMVIAGLCGLAWLRSHRPLVQDAAFAPRSAPATVQI